MRQFELAGVSFGLAQLYAHVQRLFIDVQTELNFAFEQLDDILVFSPDIKPYMH